MCISRSPFSERASFIPSPVAWAGEVPLSHSLSSSIARSGCPGHAPSQGCSCQVSLVLTTILYCLGISIIFFIYLFLTLCSLSAFPLPTYTWVSILPDRHLDPAPGMPLGPVCASCPCCSLGCLQFSWLFPDLFPAVSSSGGVLLKHTETRVSCRCCN